MTAGFRIEEGGLDHPAVQALLDFHLREAHRNSPPGSVYALDLSGLRAPGVTLWTAWDGDALAGCGALKERTRRHGEVKSMRTDPRHLRRGTAAALLDHIVGVARGRGYARLSLETGAGPAYAPALALYRRHGFAVGPAFGDYAASGWNQFMHRAL